MTNPLEKLRAAMAAQGVDAYIVPTEDPHQSEYVADHWKAREWISGFNGSAGTVCITADHAGLWTDGRYYLQAASMSSSWTLHKMDEPNLGSWLQNSLPKGSKVGLNATLHAQKTVIAMREALAVKGIALIEADLISSIWDNRPALPSTQVYEMPVELTGESMAAKLKRIRTAMVAAGATHHLVSTLDDIAWILNIRGNDVPYNPVVISYLLVMRQRTILFVNSTKVPKDLVSRLGEIGVELADYDAIETHLAALAKGAVLMASLSTVNAALVSKLSEDVRILDLATPSIKMKAIKNKTELAHIRQAMQKDGVAMVRMLRWLEDSIGKKKVTEYDVAETIARFRSEQADYVGESFGAIVGYKGNGAVIHYHAEPATCNTLEAKGILLIDSGGQYRNGTTDITRTVMLGEVSEAEKKCYTLVLKGHIALAKAVFPEGTKGVQLDTYARTALWQFGLEYAHGTGHGVGFFLNVHEPPQGFRYDAHERSSVPQEPGMLTSNEPGYYESGQFGIRIENLVVCKTAKVASGSTHFLDFETVTYCPIETRLIDKRLINKEEKAWLNNYHRMVIKKLSPALNTEEQAWLVNACKPI
jgi:Xaa-Pro aminopeptidase